MSNSKHVSIILCHYSKVDDFGETSAGKNPPKRSDLVRIAVESIKHWTDYPAELIVMDNGGNPDDTDYFVQKVREGVINTLVRYKNNMHFGFAWNQGAKLASGEYLCFICNDIEVGKGWLSTCVNLLEKYHDRKLLATPFISYDKRRNNIEYLEDAIINGRSGSNCMVIRREDFYAIGEWPHHKKGGTLWYNKMFRMGYRSIVPIEPLAQDRGYRHGVNFNIPIEVKKILLDGSELHFEDKQ